MFSFHFSQGEISDTDVLAALSGGGNTKVSTVGMSSMQGSLLRFEGNFILYIARNDLFSMTLLIHLQSRKRLVKFSGKNKLDICLNLILSM